MPTAVEHGLVGRKPSESFIRKGWFVLELQNKRKNQAWRTGDRSKIPVRRA